MQQHNEPSNCCIEALSVVVEGPGLHCGSRECLLDYAIFVAFQNNCKCLNSFWMHVVVETGSRSAIGRAFVGEPSNGQDNIVTLTEVNTLNANILLLVC